MSAASGPDGNPVLVGPFDSIGYILSLLGEHEYFGESVGMRVPIFARGLITRITFVDDASGKLRC